MSVLSKTYNCSYLTLTLVIQGGGESEQFVGTEDLHSKLKITTRAAMCLKPGGSSKEGILKGWEEGDVERD
jgi:hypothetical protein